jgi:Predicted membrane protein
MPPDTFEKYLPFAMALGVEQNWAQAFAGIIQNPPSWYVSPNGYTGFNPIYFSNSMHSMSNDMHQTFTSAPRSSSSGSGFSGGGGGGFSGGGFGGGGGSAF